jgi:hypothetical protein
MSLYLSSTPHNLDITTISTSSVTHSSLPPTNLQMGRRSNSDPKLARKAEREALYTHLELSQRKVSHLTSDSYITPQLRHRAVKLESDYWDACFNSKKIDLEGTVEALDARLEELNELVNEFESWKHRELREAFWEVELEQICKRYRA